MRASELETIYFHATFSKNVPTILKRGLVIGKTRVWNKPSGARQGDKSVIHLFTDQTSAARWAFHMEYEFEQPTSIIVIRDPAGEIVPDDHIEIQIKGLTGVKINTSIPPEAIIKVVELTPDICREVAQTGASTKVWP